LQVVYFLGCIEEKTQPTLTATTVVHITNKKEIINKINNKKALQDVITETINTNTYKFKF